MTGVVLVWCLSAQSAPGAPVPTPMKGSVEVLAGEAEYRKLALAETTTEGVLERLPAPKVGAPASRWAYRLKMQPGGRDAMIHAPGKAHLLEPLVGKRVWATGKEVAGDLWLGRVEPWKVLRPAPDARGVLARCAWSPNATLPLGPTHAIVRDGAELARIMRVNGLSAEKTATALLARRMSVTEIDWKKHMVVSVSAGLKPGLDQLTITAATVRDGTLTVAYRLSRGPGGGGFGYATETVLVPRHAGAVRLRQEASPKGKEARKERP